MKQGNNSEFNRTTLYLFPLVYEKGCFTVGNTLKNKSKVYRVLSLYLGDNGFRKKYENCILALTEVLDFDNPIFKSFFKDVQKHPLYKEYYHVDNNLIMIVFELDNYGKAVLQLFKEGKYSSFPSQYISWFASINNTIDSQYKVFTKSPLLKAHLENKLDITIPDDGELDSIPSEKDEIFRF